MKVERKKIDLEIKKKMVHLYTSGEVTNKNELGKMFGTSKRKVNDVFEEFGVGAISRTDRANQKVVFTGDKFIPTDTHTFIARHKTTNKEFSDFNNVSGILTRYLVSIGDISEPKLSYITIKEYRNTGVYWYEKYFDIVQVPIIVKEKKELDVDSLISDYVSGSVRSIRELCSKYNVGELKIKQIFIDNNVEIKKTGGQVKYNFDDYIEKYVEDDIYTYKAVCKKTGFESKDFMNKSGFLTRHVFENYGVQFDSSNDKSKKYFLENGKYWFEEYFDIVKIEKVAVRKCHYCDEWVMPLDGNDRQYKMHLARAHKINVRTHLEKYPEDKSLFVKNSLKIEKEDNINNWIVCKICGEKMQSINTNHLKKHNLTASEYKFKYGNNLSQSTYEKLAEVARNNNMYHIKPNFTSKQEIEIKSFLQSLGVNSASDRKILKGKEIDILIEDKKIGIEFNGNKWHSEWFGKKGKYYHLEKTIDCNESGYGLIQIFEDEYQYKKDIVFNKIKHLCGVNSDTIKVGARKCTIQEISVPESTEFFDKYHIQGVGQSSVVIGGYYNGILVAVMSFKRLSKDSNDYDLTRFATHSDYTCQGIASKLLKYFIREYTPTSIISFADRRWTLDKDNNLYTKLGFELVKELAPDYKYYNEKIDRYARFHKFGFRKQTLHKKYGLSMDLTETEMVQLLGYDRIWDCGLFKYKITF
jgi:ribosomal protein S18 acetylase RimI-like enzyme